jgi:GDP-L-fucose synthase
MIWPTRASSFWKDISGEAPLNVGTGEDITIGDLARLIAKVIGYRGERVFDPSRPDLNLSNLRALG